MKVTVEGNDIVIRLAANFKNPPASKTGLTKVVASSNGNQLVTNLGDRFPNVRVGVNVFISPKDNGDSES